MRSSLGRRLTTVVLWLSPLLIQMPCASQDRALFTALSDDQTAKLKEVQKGTKPNKLILRARHAGVNFDLLNAVADAGKATSEVKLHLFEDVQITASLERFLQLDAEGIAWTGTVKGRPFSSVAIVARKDNLAATIRIMGIGLFRIEPVPSFPAVFSISQMDENEMPPCGLAPQHHVGLQPAPPKDPNRKIDDPEQFDVLVVYTPKTRDAAGGTAQIENVIDLAVLETNDAYRSSGVNRTLRLVRKQLVNYDEAAHSFNDMLTHLTGKSDGQIDDVHVERDQCRADLVCMIVENNQYCGIAWLMTLADPGFESFAFSVVHRNCATGYYSFAHELGHNQGCCHDRANASGCIKPYAYGWKFTGNDGYLYRTIMAYAPGTRIQHLSNPDITFQGVPTGVPIGQPDAAHNAQVILDTSPTVANFRDD